MHDPPAAAQFERKSRSSSRAGAFAGSSYQLGQTCYSIVRITADSSGGATLRIQPNAVVLVQTANTCTYSSSTALRQSACMHAEAPGAFHPLAGTVMRHQVIQGLTRKPPPVHHTEVHPQAFYGMAWHAMRSGIPCQVGAHLSHLSSPHQLQVPHRYFHEPHVVHRTLNDQISSL